MDIAITTEAGPTICDMANGRTALLNPNSTEALYEKIRKSYSIIVCWETEIEASSRT